MAVVALVIGATVNKVMRPAPLDQAQLAEAGVFLFDAPRPIPDIQLTSATNEPWGKADLQGQWNLLFFGYTFCPDICPTTMAELRQLTHELPAEQRDQLQITMISVDPKRDTPQQMNSYLMFFDAGFTGASGDPAELARFAGALSVAYIEPDTTQDNYLVDHSGQVVIIDPNGQYVGFIRPPLRPARLSSLLPKIMTQSR
ncbi:MAG: SCO family protein [Pseudomonas sp.]